MPFLLPSILHFILLPVHAAGPEESQVILHDSFREVVPWMTDELRIAANSGKWDVLTNGIQALGADDADAGQLGDRAFLLALSAVEQGNPEQAQPHLEAMANARVAPLGYRVLIALKSAPASLALAESALSVSEKSTFYPAVLAARADMLLALDETDAAKRGYERLANLESSDEAVAYGLLRLGEMSEPDEAKRLYRKAWTHFPRAAVAAEVNEKLGAVSAGAPSWQERSVRAEKLMYLGEFKSALAEAERALKGVGDSKSEDACRVVYTRGRSFYKMNQLSSAIGAFVGVENRCAGVSDHYGASSLYLKGQAQFRTRRYAEAAKTFEQIPEKFPNHSMAEDGLLHAGISAVESEAIDAARQFWTRALAEYPKGDTTPEAAWRLAWSYYAGGDTPKALSIVDRVGEQEVSSDWEHVAGAMYWAARWRAYPDKANPSQKSTDADSVAEAVRRFRQLCERYPDSFYAILAFSRLVELDPSQAMNFDFEREPFQKSGMSSWIVRLGTYEAPAFREGVALARLGLIRPAMSAWSELSANELTGDEMALIIELRIANGDWLYAHNAFRQYLKSNPPVTTGPRMGSIVRVAYPDRYWSEVKESTKGDQMEARFFHALVREESNFNARIVSFAGAVGLSQLMPKTAEQTAGWLKMTINSASLRDPKTNLTIGAHYLDKVLTQFDGSPFLALAGYNAGPGRVKQWREKWGDIPTDEYIEQIPYKETRGYVKRVMGTWQLMRWQFDEGDPFVNLSKFNHHALKIE